MKIVLNREKLYMEMNQSLQRKYEDSFHFFQVKWINDLLDCSHRSPHYQQFLQMRIDIDILEYLKRFYYYRTSNGKLEIENRIKICGDFYAGSVSNLYEYPTMIITNTQSLFTKRAKRMKKIQAEVGSSDQTEQHPQDNEFPSIQGSNFLSELSKSNIQEELESARSELSFEESCHQIFEEKYQEKDFSLYKLPKFEEIHQNEVSHLITEMGVQGMELKKQSEQSSTSKQTLVNIENQPKSTKQSGISIIPIQEKISIRTKQKKSGILSSYLDFMLEKQVGYNHLGLKFDNPAVTEYNSIHTLSNDTQPDNKSLERQRQQRASRRQKIREKAEQLLKRARKDEELEQKY